MPAHPQRDEVIATVRGWDRQAHPAMGWRYRRLSVGHYRWHDMDPDRSWAWVTLEGDFTDDDGVLLAIDEECGEWPIPRLRIDAADLNAALGPRLLARGWSVGGNVMLAWVGDAPEQTMAAGIEIDERPDLEEWSVTKLRGFSEDDAEPTAQRLRNELGLRRAEMPGGILRLRLARRGRAGRCHRLVRRRRRRHGPLQPRDPARLAWARHRETAADLVLLRTPSRPAHGLS